MTYLEDPPQAAPAAVPASGPGLAPPCPLGALWAVRHGQSTANVAWAAAVASGATTPLPGRDREVTLSPFGTRQAAALGNWLAGQGAGRGPELVVCSPYARTRQTWQVMAEHAADLGAPRIETLVDERLRDREWGCFELYPPAAVRARSPREADRRAAMGEAFYRAPGGESFSDVAVRVGQFIGDLGRAAPGRRVLVVAHDAVVIALRQVLAGIGAAASDEPPPVPNASVSHWTGDGIGPLNLAAWADTAHLASLDPAPDAAPA